MRVGLLNAFVLLFQPLPFCRFLEEPHVFEKSSLFVSCPICLPRRKYLLPCCQDKPNRLSAHLFHAARRCHPCASEFVGKMDLAI